MESLPKYIAKSFRIDINICYSRKNPKNTAKMLNSKIKFLKKKV